MGQNEEMQAALDRFSSGQPKKPNDDFYLDKVRREGSERGRAYRDYLEGKTNKKP